MPSTINLFVVLRPEVLPDALMVQGAREEGAGLSNEGFSLSLSLILWA